MLCKPLRHLRGEEGRDCNFSQYLDLKVMSEDMRLNSVLVVFQDYPHRKMALPGFYKFTCFCTQPILVDLKTFKLARDLIPNEDKCL